MPIIDVGFKEGETLDQFLQRYNSANGEKPKRDGAMKNKLLESMLSTMKGGKGSGFFDHPGRPGKVGGSSSDESDPHPSKSSDDDGKGEDGKKRTVEAEQVEKFDKSKWEQTAIPDRKSEWEKMDLRKRDELADAPNSIPKRLQEIIGFAGDRPKTKNLKKDLNTRLDQLSEAIDPESKEKIAATIDEFDTILEKAGVSPAIRRKLGMEAVDTLVAQDHESLQRQLGDHGIAHIRGNIESSVSILNEVPGVDTADDLAEVYITQIFHDTGYMTEPSQVFLDEGHPRWSREHYDKNIRPMVQKALGDRVAGNISTYIETHASSDIDWKNTPVASAIRVADNTALFQREKLPPLFRLIPANIGILEQLASKSISLSEAQSLMAKNVRGLSSVSGKVKDQLLRAVNEVGPITGKMTLGMLGGEIDGFDWVTDKEGSGHINVRLRESKEATRLNKINDLGQRQFGKFAESYGQDPDQFKKSLKFNFRKPPNAGKTVLSSTIVGSRIGKKELSKAMFDILFR